MPKRSWWADGRRRGISLSGLDRAAIGCEASWGLASARAPEAERNVLRRRVKVLVRRHQGQIVAEAELDQESVHRSDWHATTAAGVSDFRRFQVIVLHGLEEGQR